MATQSAVATKEARPDIAAKEQRPDLAVFWQPGCSSCLKVKEFLEGTGLPFDSVNILEREGAMEEIMAAGLRSIPVVRKNGKYIYAQSLDDVAGHIGVTRNHKRLPNDVLLDRWDPILTKARAIIAQFSDEDLEKDAIPTRKRTIKKVSVHIFQIVIAFRRQIEDGITEIKPIQGYMDPSIKTRADVLAFAEKVQDGLRTWLANGGRAMIADRLQTYYGQQDSGQVIERAVWHCTQHTRQLDHVCVGRLGKEFLVPPELYAGLPLPARIWA
jgi:glutaredoxin